MSSVGLFRELATHPLKALDRVLPEDSGVIVYFPDGIRAEIGIGVDLGNSDLAILDNFPKPVSDLGTTDKERLRHSLNKKNLRLELTRTVERSLAADKNAEQTARSKGQSYRRNTGRDSTADRGCGVGFIAAAVTFFVIAGLSDSEIGAVVGLLVGIFVGFLTLIPYSKRSNEVADRAIAYSDIVSRHEESIVPVSPETSRVGAKVGAIESDLDRIAEIGLETNERRQLLSDEVLSYMRACTQETTASNTAQRHEEVIAGVPYEEVSKDEDLAWARDRLLQAMDDYESASAARDEHARTIADLAREVEKERTVAEAKLRATRHRRESDDY